MGCFINCVLSLHSSHADILCTVPVLVWVLLKCWYVKGSSLRKRWYSVPLHWALSVLIDSYKSVETWSSSDCCSVSWSWYKLEDHWFRDCSQIYYYGWALSFFWKSYCFLWLYRNLGISWCCYQDTSISAKVRTFIVESCGAVSFCEIEGKIWIKSEVDRGGTWMYLISCL